jgi:dihydroxyacetone kinase-like protein
MPYRLNNSDKTATMMEYFTNEQGAPIVQQIIAAIQANKVYLSDIDGHIGDGDHGINMNKGFTLAGERISPEHSFDAAMKSVGDTLLLEIGGSMGPIYGTFFRRCAASVRSAAQIDAACFGLMLRRALEDVKEIGGAKVGDKTLIDTLEPAVVTFEQACSDGQSFHDALTTATSAAEAGMESTRDMVARIGRAARLGERSVGVQDAGATSCFIILKAMFDAIRTLIS